VGRGVRARASADSLRDRPACRYRRAQRHETSGQRPHIYSSYSTLNGKAFAPFQRTVTNEAELRVAVNDLVRAGAVQIKIHRVFPAELMPVAVQLAHEHGLTLTGHIPTGLHPLQACEAGMDAARVLRIEARTGMIEVGKDADFQVLDEDPGRDVRALRRVFASGRGWPRD
jgi:Amidohydrolase family